MKRKIFSKLLMGAFLIASVSSFVSCKDYDDDINDLRSQINGLNTSIQTTVDSKVSGVSSTVNTLQSQLADVKTAYASADAALQKAIDDAKASAAASDAALQKAIDDAKANASADKEALQKAIDNAKAEAKAAADANAQTISALQTQVAQLAAAKENLENAISTLQTALNEANASLKTQGESIVSLIAADKTLQQGIDIATANAANALEEAKKAQESAAALATSLAGTQAEIAKLAETVANNLTSVNAQIEKAVASLQAQIDTLNGKVDDLSKKAAANEANITTILAKLTSLEAKDKEILDKIDANYDKLDSKYDASIKALAEKIQKNLDEITKIKDVTIAEVRNAMAGEAKAAVAEALKTALDDYLSTDDVVELIATAQSENEALIDALAAKVKQDSIDIRTYVDVEFLQVVKDLIAAEKSETTAGTIAAAYKAADQALQDSIDVVAANLKEFIESINSDKEAAAEAAGLLTGRVADIEALLTSEEGALNKLGESILASEEFTAAVKEAVGELNGEILEMITSINLFHNTHEWDQEAGSGFYPFDHAIDFLYATEFDNVFPKKSDFVYEPNLFVNASKNYTFVQGTLRTETDSILVRVSPANAKLNKAKLALLDSKGNDVVASGLIEIESVHKYNQLLTRAAETGLWVIKFKLAEGDNGEAFEKAAFTTVNGGWNNILYAVGAQNTASAEERYVVSEYDLQLFWSPAQRATTFSVNGIVVDELKNRYYFCEDGSRTDLLKQGSNVQGQHPELMWLKEYDENGAYVDEGAYTNVIISGATKNAADPRFENGYNYNDYPWNYDNRQSRPVLKVLPGQDISIVYDNSNNKRIKGFYVTLDADFALESAPSEYNAWCSYDYENVGYAIQKDGKFTGEYVPAPMQDGMAGKIVIKNTKNVLHDIIGFRVYAVNLDGTLVDPDGRAFYVYVGEDTQANEIPAINVTTTVQYPSVIPGEENRGSQKITEGTFIDSDYRYANGYIRWEFRWGENNPAVLYNGDWAYPVANTINGYTRIGDPNTYYTNQMRFYRLFNLEFCNGNNDGQWQDLADEYSVYSSYGWNILSPTTNAIRAQIEDASRLIDGETYTIKAAALRYRSSEGASNQTQTQFLDTVQIVNIKIKKLVPATIPSNLKIRANQLTNDRTLTVYVKPVDGNYVEGNNYQNHPFAVDNTLWQVNQADNFTYVADVKPYDFADIFTGLTVGNEANKVYDENYVFEVENSDKVNPADPTSANKSIFVGYDYVPQGTQLAVNGFATAPWNAYAVNQAHPYSLPAVNKAFVNDGEKKKVNISYLYRGISLTKNADGTVNGPKDLRRTLSEVKTDNAQSAFYVTYNCALNLPGIGKMNNNQIVSTANDAWTKYEHKDKDANGHDALVAAYNAKFETTYETDYTLDLSNLVLNPQRIDGLKHATAAADGHIGIALTKTYEPAKDYTWDTDFSYITLKDLFNTGVLLRHGSSITVTPSDYYTASMTDNWIALRRIRSYDEFLASDLKTDVPHTVTFNVSDVFGHLYTFSFNVTMKKPAMHARQR